MANEIEETIEYLSDVLERIQLATTLPPTLHNKLFEGAQSASLRLLAAICDYLALGIQNVKQSFAGMQNTQVVS